MPQLLTELPPQPLCLGIVGQDCDITHVVQPGDTCDIIAQEAKTTLPILLVNNPDINTFCTNLLPGVVSRHEACMKTYSRV